MVLPLNNFRSNFNDRSYSILTNEDLNCRTRNVVYLVTCTVCKLQYVGETSREFHIRAREHLDKIRKGDKSQHLYRHFSSDDQHRGCPLEKRVRFQIIERIVAEDDPPLEPGQMRKRRTDRELHWIAKLRTGFPLGLNDKVSGYGIHGNTTDSSFGDYNCFRIENINPRKHNKRRGRHSKRKAKGRINEGDLDRFRQEMTERWDSEPGKIESFICSKPRNFVNRFVSSAHLGTLSKPLVYILTNLGAYFTKARLTSTKTDRIRWQVQLTHKIIDEVNLNRIMNLREVKGTIPGELRGVDNPQIVYKFSKTVGARVLNYNNVLKNMGALNYQAIQDMRCECDGSEFKHPQLGHIMTGDLGLIKDEGLRAICAKGAKFREVPYLDTSKIKRQIRGDIDNISKKWATKNKIGNGKLKN